MRLERATYKAMKYACTHFHYAKRVPAQPMIGYSVFEARDWCGCVIFNGGLRNIEKPFALPQGTVAELVRVALNGKQNKTSQVVSMAVRLFKKSNPLVRILVSYADTDEGHNGTLYQAMNWYFIDSIKTGDAYIDPKTGKQIHRRAHSPSGLEKQFGVLKRVPKTSELTRVSKGKKNKYIYPLTRRDRKKFEHLRKPYPRG